MADQIVEAAFSLSEYMESDQAVLTNMPDRWNARVTWKCPVDGRRNSELLSGSGCFKQALPLKVVCKYKHETLVMPYRWKESEFRCSHNPEVAASVATS
jgi:hypothetical protein